MAYADYRMEQEKKRRWVEANRAWKRECDRNYCARNPDKVRKNRASWASRNRDKIRMKQQRRLERLSDWYVRKLLSMGSDVRKHEWPAELVEAKRAHVRLTRKIREYRKETANTIRGQGRVVSDVLRRDDGL